MAPRRSKTLEMARRTEGGVALEGRLVLIADDDRAIIRKVREGLGEQRYRFVEAYDGTQALTALRTHKPDLLVMDVEMPGLGGVEVCRIVKANQTDTGF